MAQFPWKKGKKRPPEQTPPTPPQPQRLPYSRRGEPFEGEGIPPDMAIRGKPVVKQRRFRNA